MARRPKKPKLPPYVVEKGSEWHVRLNFPSRLRDKKGRIVYEQMSRKCEPKTELRAAEIVELLRAERGSAKPITDPSTTLRDFLEQFLSVKKGSVSQRTYEFYLYIYEQHIQNAAIAKMALTQITPLDVQLYLTNLGASPPRTKKVALFISMAFKQAIAWELLTKNPTAGVILPKFTPKESLAMTKAEARSFIQACRTDDRYIVFEFALETGLRPQETLAIRWQDIDLAHRRISVKKAIAEGFVGGGFEVKDPKTESSKRTNGISVELRDRLRRHKELQDEYLAEIRAEHKAPLTTQKKVKGVNYTARKLRRELAGEKLADFAKYNLVFPASNGKPQAKGNLNRREFKAVLNNAGLDPTKYSFETLRHTCLTLRAKFMNPKQLQRFAGHAHINTTMIYYVHIDDDSHAESSNAMAAALY